MQFFKNLTEQKKLYMHIMSSKATFGVNWYKKLLKAFQPEYLLNRDATDQNFEFVSKHEIDRVN